MSRRTTPEDPSPELVRRWITAHRKAVGRHLQPGTIVCDGQVANELERLSEDGRWVARRIWPSMVEDSYRLVFDPTTPCWSALPESLRATLFVGGALAARRNTAFWDDPPRC